MNPVDPHASSPWRPQPAAALEPAIRASLVAVRDARTIAITAHPKPDGDAVGSCLGLVRLLRAAGKKAVVAGLSPLPRCYADLPQPGEVCEVKDVPGHAPDLLMVLDVAARDRMPEGMASLAARTPIVNIDHHADNTLFGTVNLVDAEASSTGEIIYYLAWAAGYALQRESAIPLWIAIVTDTGRFSHENTTPRALHTAAELLVHGVPTASIERRIYGSLTRGELELRRRALQRLEVYGEGRIVFAILEPGDFTAAGCGPEDIGDLIDIPRSIEGVEVAALFYEHRSRPGIHVSTRSNTSCDVSRVCRSLGGGGHARAAGCTIDGNMAAAKARVLEALRREGVEGAHSGEEDVP